MWRNFCYAVPGAFACKKIENALANRDLAKANLYHLTIVPLSIGIPSALLVFGSLFFGADLINNALNAIPQFVMDGLNVASGVMVCIGFALLIRTMGDNKLLPWPAALAGNLRLRRPVQKGRQDHLDYLGHLCDLHHRNWLGRVCGGVMLADMLTCWITN